MTLLASLENICCEIGPMKCSKTALPLTGAVKL